MNILDILYTIFIGPLKLLFEFIYTFSYHITNNAGISIVLLSLALNLLLMPLYKKADAIQDEENATQNKLKPGVDHIKKAFKGDEQFMVLQAYYRQNNYKPIYALRNSISLLLEIPFFVAAYSFLSDLAVLQGSSFFMVKDLGSPDGLLFGLNLLPILMTAINVVSCIVYTKGQPFRARMQLYLMAALFLVLLYNSPSGLALYYTLNNIFSLIKNIIAKIKNKSLVFGILTISIGLLLSVVLVMKYSFFSMKVKAVLALVIVCLIAFGLYCLIKKQVPKIDIKDEHIDRKSFIFGCLVLTVLLGLLIPSAVINASPEEFVDPFSLTKPVVYIINTLALSIGTFMVWGNVFYSLMEKGMQKILNYLFSILAFVAIANYLFFGKDFGNISNTLVYDLYPEIQTNVMLTNVLVCLLVGVVIYFVYKKKESIIKYALVVISVALLAMSVVNVSNISKVSSGTIEKMSASIDAEPRLLFSKTEKNVVVLMLDRAISFYLPYILDERPELIEKFDGFTYYPNTVSFGQNTKISTPSLFGGYEYSPEEINKRKDESLCDKQNEALKVLPVLFNSNDYDVTVFDPPYAGYEYVPNLSIYDDYEEINAYITEGRYDLNGGNTSNPLLALNRNLFCYSISKSVPIALFTTLYDHGRYLTMDKVVEEQPIESWNINFDKSFAALKKYKEISIIDEGKGSFMMLQNSSTHEPVLLQTPDYTPTKDFNNDAFNEEHKDRYSIYGGKFQFGNEEQESHYHVNIATLLELGQWFDYLRENDVYDNTRIIIASDHGRHIYLNRDIFFNGEDLLLYNALLMVKDFNATGFEKDETLMTCADVPYLATEGLISNPVNPFTNKEIEKNTKTQFNIFASMNWDLNDESEYVFDEAPWYSVHDYIFDVNNWSIIDDPNN